MSSTATLLLLAIQLLTLVTHSPNLPPSLRDTAINVAQQAITAAQDPANNGALTGSTVASNTPPQQPVYYLPIYTGVTPAQITNQTAPTSMPQETQPQLIAVPAPGFEQGSGVDAANDVPFGVYFFKVSYIDANGNFVKGLDSDGVKIPEFIVTMSASDQTYSATFDTTKSGKPEDRNNFYHIFQYTPKAQGNQTVRFSLPSGMSVSVDVNVK